MTISKVELNPDGTMDFTVVSDTGERYSLTGCYPISVDMPGGESVVQEDHNITLRYKWLVRHRS